MVDEVAYVNAWRPWMALYGVRLNQKTKDETDVKDLGLIEQMLPDEMLLMVFKFLSPTNLGIAQCVSQQWKAVGATPTLWKTCCIEAFNLSDIEIKSPTVLKPYKGSWKRMFMYKPHLRFDGIYVSRNTYIKTGVAEWRVNNPVHLVCYFRYARFLPDGRLYYRTSPETVSKVAKSMAQASNPNYTKLNKTHQVQQGRYILEGDKLFTALRYENSTSTEIRSRMKLRSTCPGANNRLDIETIFSWDREDGRSMPMLDVRSDEDAADEGVAQRRYNRGLSPFVFVPWDAVNSSQLNLPVTEMDVFIPG